MLNIKSGEKRSLVLHRAAEINEQEIWKLALNDVKCLKVKMLYDNCSTKK